MQRHINFNTKQKIIANQNNKCKGVDFYICPLLFKNNGYFDESGYEIDHIIEHSLTKDNDIQNLQALCSACHSYKTKQFQKIKINRKYLFKCDYKDTTFILVDIYNHCKKIITENNVLCITNYIDINNNMRYHHLCQFKKEIEADLLIKYLASSCNIKYDIKDCYKNNIFLIIY